MRVFILTDLVFVVCDLARRQVSQLTLAVYEQSNRNL